MSASVELMLAMKSASEPDQVRWHSYPPNPTEWLAFSRAQLDARFMAIALSLATGAETLESAITETDRIYQAEADMLVAMWVVWLFRQLKGS